MTRRTFGGRARAFGRVLAPGRARAIASIVAPAAAVAALAALGACDNLSPKVSGIPSHDPGSGPIVIGHFASLTGSEATFGASDKNGLTLAVEERNARGGVHGRPIEVIRLDDASKAAEAGTAVTRLG